MAQRRVGIWYNDSKENSLETAYQLVGVLRRQGVKPVMGPMLAQALGETASSQGISPGCEFRACWGRRHPAGGSGRGAGPEPALRG